MPEIVTPFYTVKKSDNRKWIIIQSPAGKEIDVEIRVLDYHYDCKPQLIPYEGGQIPCSYLCCYQGCYIDEREIKSITEMLPHLKPMLQPDAIKVLEKYHDQIFVPSEYDPEEKLWKTRCAPCEWEEKSLSEHNDEESLAKDLKNVTLDDGSKRPRNYCIFLMENGLCSIHKWCNDCGKNWVKDKFNICVTFPIDIRPQDKTIAFMSGFDSFTFGNVDCINPDELKKAKLGMPQVVDSMKYAIVDRYGEEWWNALNYAAQDYRAGKIDMKFIYRDFVPKPSKTD